MKTLLNIAKKSVLPLLAIVGAAYAIHYSLWGQKAVPAESQAAPVSTSVPSSPTQTVLAGPGMVEPAGREVKVAPPLQGIVEWVIGQDRVGTMVKKGEVLLRLDSKELKAELDVRKAQLASFQAQLNRLKNMPRTEELKPLEEKWRKTKIEVEKTKGEYDRALNTRNANASAISVQELQEYKFAHEAAQAQAEMDLADWRLKKAGTWKEDIQVAEAAVKSAESQVAQTETQLERLTVLCPSDLKLYEVDVRPQEFVGIPPQQAIMKLGKPELNVRVFIDEHDASRFKSGAKAIAHLQYGPETLKFPLVYVDEEPLIVPKPSLTGEQTERVDVRVFQVIYRFENDVSQTPIKSGQQLDVLIEEK